MKTVTLLLIAVVASAAVAGLDPATDSFGVYFDTDGNTNCTAAAAMLPVSAHLVLMNPEGPFNGWECSIVLTGAPHFVLSSVLHNTGGGGPCFLDHEGGGWAVGTYNDYPVRPSGAVLLVTWTILLQETSELLFHIGPHPIPSLPGGLPVVSGNGILRLGNVASGDVTLPVAGINAANCPVSEEVGSFGDVKSLFR